MNVSKIFKTMAAVALAAGSMAVLPVSAENSYDAIGGGTVEFEKYLVYDATANCPTAEFSFTIADGTAIAPDKTTNKAAVYAGNSDPGVNNVAPVIKNTADNTKGAKAVFNSSKDKFTTVQTLDDQASLGQHTTLVNDPVDLTGGKAYSRDRVTVDLTGTLFSEPGVYRWVITETAMTEAQTNMGFTADSDTTRFLDVYIQDTGFNPSTNKGTLSVVGYVLHNDPNFQPIDQAGAGVTPSEPASTDSLTKAMGFTNAFTTHSLTIANDVAGNQASHDKYFKYDVTIENAGNGNVMNVVLTNADATTGSNAATLDGYENITQPTSMTTGTTGENAGKATATFYLQHGQNIVIQGIPLNAKYTVVVTGEDYTPSLVASGDTINGKTGDTAVSISNAVTATNTAGTIVDNNLTADATLTVTNTRVGTIPTGVLTSLIPGIAILALGGAGIVALRKKKEDEE